MGLNFFLHNEANSHFLQHSIWGSSRNQMTCGKLPGLLSYGVYGFIEKKIMVVVEIKKGRITPFCGIFGQQT